MKRMVSDVKSEKLAQELKDLETRGDDELKERWRSLYGTKPPQKIHRSLLIAAITHRMQENELGALKPSAGTVLNATECPKCRACSVLNSPDAAGPRRTTVFLLLEPRY